ncbi:hypothetical protein Q3G72_028387 [Acer saccharum]|nr:hypothetical protein Q3G72_028387 [Acer saccharum]
MYEWQGGHCKKEQGFEQIKQRGYLGCENGVFSDPLEGPTKLTVRHKNHKKVSFSNKQGKVLSHPLKGPIQLPLNGLEGDQIVGKDLEPLHLEVELVTDVSRIAEPNKTTEKGNRFMKDIIVKSLQQSNKSYWNLEEEIAKVIEKGVSLGYVFKSNEKDRDKEHIVMQEDHYNSRSNQGESQENSWNFDNEVAKVIKVGVALGFDFNGNEVEIGEKIANREKEDKALMATANDL